MDPEDSDAVASAVESSDAGSAEADVETDASLPFESFPESRSVDAPSDRVIH
jgi:hypothetical protein